MQQALPSLDGAFQFSGGVVVFSRRIKWRARGHYAPCLPLPPPPFAEGLLPFVSRLPGGAARPLLPPSQEGNAGRPSAEGSRKLISIGEKKHPHIPGEGLPLPPQGKRALVLATFAVYTSTFERSAMPLGRRAMRWRRARRFSRTSLSSTITKTS